jgi:hypothetical protein
MLDGTIVPDTHIKEDAMSDTMSLVSCRECNHDVSDGAFACPYCGAVKPWNPEWNGWGFEYKSKRMLFGLPLLHIAFGRDRRYRLRVAKGIIAIGQFARGWVVIAQFGVGFVTIAQFGMGLVGIMQFGLGGALLAQLAIAFYAIAQMAVVFVTGRGQLIVELLQRLAPAYV